MSNINILTKEELMEKKKELGLEKLSDKDILKLALICSGEMKMILREEGTNLNNKDLIDTLGKVDELLLTEWSRVRDLGDIEEKNEYKEQTFDI